MKNLVYSTILVCITALFSSCGGQAGKLFGGNPTDKAASYAKAIKLIKEKTDLDKFKIYSVRFVEGEALSNDMMHVDLSMVSPDNIAYKQVFYLNGNVGDLRKQSSSIDDIDYEKIKVIDVTKIDPEAIEKQCAEAQQMVPEGHTYKSIGRYEVKEILPKKTALLNKGRNIGAQETTFDIRFTEDGKETEVNGGKVTYLYYEAEVQVNADGTLSVEEK